MKKKVEKDLFPDLPLYPHLYLHGGWFLLFTLSLSLHHSPLPYYEEQSPSGPFGSPV